MVCHIQDKNDKKLKKQNCYKNTKKKNEKTMKGQKQRKKNFFGFSFFFNFSKSKQ